MKISVVCVISAYERSLKESRAVAEKPRDAAANFHT